LVEATNICQLKRTEAPIKVEKVNTANMITIKSEGVSSPNRDSTAMEPPTMVETHK